MILSTLLILKKLSKHKLYILVTDGVGFIGSVVIRYLIVFKDNSVINVGKITNAGKPESLQSVTIYQRYHVEHADICDLTAIRKAFDKPGSHAGTYLTAALSREIQFAAVVEIANSPPSWLIQRLLSPEQAGLELALKPSFVERHGQGDYQTAARRSLNSCFFSEGWLEASSRP